MLLKLVLFLGALDLRDVEGVKRQPLVVPKGREAVLFFVMSDCPISNAFAPEIRRICSDYGPKGVDCSLVYVDPTLTDAQARAHAAEYGHGGYPKIVDRRHQLVKATGVAITPEVAVVNAGGQIVYRGRIDDSFAALGAPRRPVTHADLRDALDATLAGRAPQRSETEALGCYIPDLKVLGK